MQERTPHIKLLAVCALNDNPQTADNILETKLHLQIKWQFAWRQTVLACVGWVCTRTHPSSLRERTYQIPHSQKTHSWSRIRSRLSLSTAIINRSRQGTIVCSFTWSEVWSECVICLNVDSKRSGWQLHLIIIPSFLILTFTCLRGLRFPCSGRDLGSDSGVDSNVDTDSDSGKHTFLKQINGFVHFCEIITSFLFLGKKNLLKNSDSSLLDTYFLAYTILGTDCWPNTYL